MTPLSPRTFSPICCKHAKQRAIFYHHEALTDPQSSRCELFNCTLSCRDKVRLCSHPQRYSKQLWSASLPLDPTYSMLYEMLHKCFNGGECTRNVRMFIDICMEWNVLIGTCLLVQCFAECMPQDWFTAVLICMHVYPYYNIYRTDSRPLFVWIVDKCNNHKHTVCI